MENTFDQLAKLPAYQRKILDEIAKNPNQRIETFWARRAGKNTFKKIARAYLRTHVVEVVE